MNKSSYFINASGSNIRKVGKEALQTIYVLTKDPKPDQRKLTIEETKFFLSLKPEDLTFEKMVDIFGDLVDIRNNDKHQTANKSPFQPSDIMKLSHSDYSLIDSKEPIITTVGRFIFNKILIEGLHFENVFRYQNKCLRAGDYGKFDSAVATALKDKLITVDQMYNYVNTRDWFGLQMHGIITTSFTPGVLQLPKDIKELKKKLIEENREALNNGDARVMEKIENELITKTKEAMKDDIGLDLYNSGARGSVNNHLKNILITRGAVMNPITGKYDIIENSLMDGLAKKDIAATSNIIVTGAYPKAVIL